MAEKIPVTKLSCIGKVVATEGITLRDGQGTRPLSAQGYVHFS